MAAHAIPRRIVDRRSVLAALASAFLPASVRAAPTVSTLIGTGTPGHSDSQVNDPYGLAFGPDGALYFCDLGNARVRRLDLRTRRTADVATSLNKPHEIAFDAGGHLYVVERDGHVVRRIDRRTGALSTVAGTGVAGYSGDGGPASQAQLRQPHSIAIDRRGRLLICDVGNHCVRAVDLAGGTIATIGGTGERLPTPDGAPLRGTPLNGPRTMVVDRDGTIYLALREGNALYRVDARSGRLHHLAGTGQQGYSGDGAPARSATLAGPKGLALAGRLLYVADTENHAIRRIDLDTGIITTALGTGERGDGPDGDPLRCRLSRPHGVLAGRGGTLYVGDSEAHRIRVLRTPPSRV